MNKLDQKGAAHIGLVVVVILVLVVVGFVFWRVQNQTADAPPAESTSEVEQQETIESESDLREAEEGLDQTDIDAELDLSEIDEVLTEE